MIPELKPLRGQKAEIDREIRKVRRLKAKWKKDINTHKEGKK